MFAVLPYSHKLARAPRKMPKLYFIDNADVPADFGAWFDNRVACTLLKRVLFLEDHDGFRHELRYLRDKQ